MQVRLVQDLAALCVDSDGREETLDLALVGAVEPGTWVLGFLGAAREILTPEQAADIARALRGLAAVMNGGDLGDAFADLENREPQLPPHLEAARRAGRATA